MFKYFFFLNIFIFYFLVWIYIHRIFILLESFIHPHNEGKWTSNLLNFYRIFTSKYIYRNRYERKLKDLMNSPKKSEKKEESKEYNYEEELDCEIKEVFEEEDEEDEEDLINLSKENEHYNEKRLAYILDEEAHDKFLEIILKGVKFMIFLKENKHRSIANICLVIISILILKLIIFLHIYFFYQKYSLLYNS